VLVVHGGDLDALRNLLATHPGLANARIPGRHGGFRTPLHLVAEAIEVAAAIDTRRQALVTWLRAHGSSEGASEPGAKPA
jgi:hypothetical protein